MGAGFRLTVHSLMGGARGELQARLAVLQQLEGRADSPEDVQRVRWAIRDVEEALEALKRHP